VFFDPDNGMEPGRATEKHLRFEELAGVLARMDATSVAVVFQYGRRVGDFWAVMARQLRDRLQCPLVCIAEPTLAFYVLAGSVDRRDEARGVLQRIAARHTPGMASHRIVTTADDPIPLAWQRAIDRTLHQLRSTRSSPLVAATQIVPADSSKAASVYTESMAATRRRSLRPEAGPDGSAPRRRIRRPPDSELDQSSAVPWIRSRAGRYRNGIQNRGACFVPLSSENPTSTRRPAMCRVSSGRVLHADSRVSSE